MEVAWHTLAPLVVSLFFASVLAAVFKGYCMRMNVDAHLADVIVVATFTVLAIVAGTFSARVWFSRARPRTDKDSVLCSVAFGTSCVDVSPGKFSPDLQNIRQMTTDSYGTAVLLNDGSVYRWSHGGGGVFRPMMVPVGAYLGHDEHVVKIAKCMRGLAMLTSKKRILCAPCYSVFGTPSPTEDSRNPWLCTGPITEIKAASGCAENILVVQPGPWGAALLWCSSTHMYRESMWNGKCSLAFDAERYARHENLPLCRIVHSIVARNAAYVVMHHDMSCIVGANGSGEVFRQYMPTSVVSLSSDGYDSVVVELADGRTLVFEVLVRGVFRNRYEFGSNDQVQVRVVGNMCVLKDREALTTEVWLKPWSPEGYRYVGMSHGMHYNYERRTVWGPRETNGREICLPNSSTTCPVLFQPRNGGVPAFKSLMHTTCLTGGFSDVDIVCQQLA
jgi:hypothetical protein